MQAKNGMLAMGLIALLATTAPANAPKLSPVDVAGLKKQIAAKKGKVVVVNFWATWCGPCVKEMPDLAKLQREQKAKGVEVITISCDEKGAVSRAEAILTKSGISGNTFINTKAENIEPYLAYMEPNATDAGLPRTYIFDRTGKLVKSMTGENTYQSFSKAVAPYVAKK
jgi:thiol-disulfide isomerase/thioredoxin